MTSNIRRAQRRPVDLNDLDLVSVGHLDGRDGLLPAVIRPTRPGVDLPAWGRAHASDVQQLLATYGVVLFRGFDVDSPSAFSAAAGSVVDELFGDYGDLPREEDGDRVFSSTPYPSDLPIHFHNESSHMSQWPMRIFFHCVTAAETGGETPLLDCRALIDELDQTIVADFTANGLTYVRNFGKGVDVSWQDFYRTEDPAEVERRCAESGTTCEWREGGLRIRQAAAAVREHPRSGEQCFFNQVLLHHPAALPPDTRTAMRELYDDDAMPRNVTYGDGTEIPDAVIAHLLEEYDRRAVRFAWEARDIILLDNMLVSHGRAPYTGARKILVAMGEMEHAS